MNDRLVWGKYVAADSWFHRLDPRAKIIATLLFMFSVFLVDSLAEAGVVALFTCGAIGMTRIPVSRYVRALRPLLFIMLFILVFHLVATRGNGTVLVAAGPFTFYSGGLERGTLAVARMILFVAFASILTFTTPPGQLTQALEHLSRPLARFGFPAGKLALMVSISLRFIPTVFEEAEKIVKAQLSRGLDLESKPLSTKARLLVSLLVPVTVGAIRRALELAESMAARGYAIGKPRTSFYRLVWKARDSWFITAVAGLLFAVWKLG